MIMKFFRRDPSAKVIDRLHGDIVAAVRQPSLYLDYGVADTFDGRFELLVLFTTAAVRRLETLEGTGPALAQSLVDSVFAHLEIALREMGVSDIAVPKRLTRLASEFGGRSRVYGAALSASDSPALEDALSRNVFGGRFGTNSREVGRLARYITTVDRAIAATPAESIGKMPLPFPAAMDTPAQETPGQDTPGMDTPAGPGATPPSGE